MATTGRGVVWLHFNRFGAKRGEDVWTVVSGKRRYYTSKVHIHVAMETVYRGSTGRQPRAYLKGRGRARFEPDGSISIVASARRISIVRTVRETRRSRTTY